MPSERSSTLQHSGELVEKRLGRAFELVLKRRQRSRPSISESIASTRYSSSVSFPSDER